ncbi:hypothetical protein QYE76_022476 [Lolium multiflorum]|uniref:Uncharacterized protein n=1 Tax=Lolium multiflorum TaxID=4521 RepID=A0AAD8RBL2_LOLMU|nr:hypothetical protein QYE76_022476 [Lolium multiflorum]
MHTHARACMARSERAGHVDARAAPLTPAPPSAPNAPRRHREPPRHGHWPAGTPCATPTPTTSATVLAAPVMRSSSSRPRFHRNQAQRDRTDVAHTRASSPVPLRRCSRVADDEMEPYVQTETYDLENGGSLVFERDLYLVSEKLERPPPQFHGVRIHDTPTGEQQWMITADLKGLQEREREINHIATVEPSAPGVNYSLLIMETAMAMKMAVKTAVEMTPGQFPARVPEQRLLSPELEFRDVAAPLDVFWSFVKREQQWMITADLKGSSEPPISERILFSFKACNWPDGLAHALQEGLARVCGQNIAALRGSRFAYFARHDTMGEPMALSSHPVLKIHVQHLDFMLHETRKDLELTRVHAHRAQMALAHHADAIRMLAKDRKSLRLQRAKKDATISRLREKIRTLEVTVRTQQDQIQEMEEDGEDIQGGDDFLSDDNDFEDDEFTDEEDYAFLESEEDGIIPIDVDEDDE